MQDRYHVLTGPPLSPPGVTAQSLEPLAAALNALEQPAVTALNDLTVGMVELAFNSLRPKERQELLRGLGIRMSAPRRAGPALCRDVLARLRREATQNACTCGLLRLTSTVISQVTAYIFSPDGVTVPEPVSRWGETLIRITVYVWSNASVGDAHILLWAGDQDWFAAAADEKEKARFDAVLDAARSVAAAHPDFVFGGTAERAASPGRDMDAGRTGDHDGPSVTVPETAPALRRSDPEAADPEAACRALESAVAEAREAAARVTEAVLDGRAPGEEHLAPLTALGAEFTRAEAVFRAAGLGDVPPRLADLVSAARAHREARERDLPVRRTLEELLHVAAGPDSPAAPAAEAVRAAAGRLLASATWEEPQRHESDALASVARLVRLGGREDAAKEIVSLMGHVVGVWPEYASAAALAPQLTLTGVAESVPAPAGTGTVGHLSEETETPPGEKTASRARPEAEAATPVVVNGETAPPSAEQVKSGEGGDQVHDSEARAEAEVTPSTPPVEPEAEAAVEPAPQVEAVSSDPVPSGATAADATVPEAERPARTETAAATEATRVAGSSVEQALVRLIVERRFGLAHHVARAAAHPEAQVAALRLAGAAALLTSGDSQGARLTADLLQQYDGHGGRDAEGGELLLLPALLRTALITGDHVAGAQLRVLVPRLPERLGEVAAAVADRALSGALMIASPLVVIADAAGTEARLRELREQCHALLAPPKLRFARATEIAKRWLAEDGMLGELLTSVAEDDRETVNRVREQSERLSKLGEINNEIDRMDRRHRGSSGKPLQGSGRQDLVHLVERVTGLLKEWCLMAEAAHHRKRSDGDRAVKDIGALRRSLLDGKEAVLGELAQLARRSGTFATATAWAARDSMEELFALLAGDTGSARPGGSVAPEILLDIELLKVCDRRGETAPLDQLVVAVGRNWAEALAERLAHDAFAAARTIIELAALELLPATRAGEFTPPPLDEIEEREAVRRAELRRTREELVSELHRAQADGAVTDDQDLRLQEMLADARNRLEGADTPDLVDVRRALDTVRGDLPLFRQQATDRIRARLDALETTAPERAQVLRHLDTGGLATAADLVYFLEIGEQVPEIETGDPYLTEFFPAVPGGLPEGIDQALVALVRRGGTHPTLPVLDYAALSPDEAALAADALDAWRELGAIEPRDRLEVSGRRQLPPLLKLLGYEAKGARPTDERAPHTRRREYRLFEAEVETNGKAKVPAFGSEIKEQGGILRVLMVWGRPSAQFVMSLAERDTTGPSLLVVYFGTLSPEARVELAAGSDQLQPLLVVDDAALAYLAARGNRQISTATQTLLPFSGVNPYIREKRGRIGGEMFYGRDAERQSIIDPRGTQVIFGGRGLGKSALLADAGERFAERRPGYQQAVYVNLDHENIGKGSALGPEALWSVLDRELTAAQVLDRLPNRKAKQNISDRVRAGIRRWLEGDSRRRLLILLDECDQFFEADAPRFDQTKRLKGLGSDTKDRAKVVFAGLHSVQRFAKLASNGPFGHLAQTPKVIGPLAPQFAADLLVEPMRVLGFEFKDLDLVNRVLGYCSYQPFLLQMFGHRLVEVMHRKRAKRGVAVPPYTVEDSDIETVESDSGLRDAISAAFKDTLSLDHRYDVIANVLARHARHRGLEVRLTDTELREECETFWRAGFQQLDTEGFRAYLSEMVGLGVLAPNHDGQGWHLRGPNALRMIGTSHEVEERLLRADQDCELQESIVQEGRPELSDGRSAPLTITQLDDLLGERANQTKVVLGTLATGVKDVGNTLRTIAGRIADWTLPPVGSPKVYKQELTGGRPRERRVIIHDFATYPAKPEACREAVDWAETLLPVTPGVTRAVVLVTDPDQLELWRTQLTGAEHTSATPVVLRRHDRRSLRGWTQRVEMFHTEDRLERLYELTGGWPLLVDRAHRLHGELGDPDEVLRRLAGLVMDQVEARAFAEATGVYADRLLATAYRALDEEFTDGTFDLESAVTAVAVRIDSEDEARWLVSFLDALQVFDREGTQLRLERLLRRCLTPPA